MCQSYCVSELLCIRAIVCQSYCVSELLCVRAIVCQSYCVSELLCVYQRCMNPNIINVCIIINSMDYLWTNSANISISLPR